MGRLGRWCYRNRRAVLATWVVALAVLGGLALGLGGRFENDFRISGSESQDALTRLQSRFPQYGGDPLVVPFHADAGINDPGVRSRVQPFLDAVSKLDGVKGVMSPYTGIPSIAPDGKTAIAQIQLGEFGPKVDPALVRDIIHRAEAISGKGLEVDVGGPTAMFAELEPPGGREASGILIALVILLVTFGSAIAAGLPILVALGGLGAGMALVLLSTRVIAIFTFAPAMAAMIGLGVGIDYALFIVTRYRQGLYAGLGPEEAIVTAVDTSGRAVVFAGTTVTISLLGMVLMGVSMVVGMAISASLAVVCTVLAAITLLPAVLGFIGANIDRLSVKRLRHADHDPRSSVWYRWSRQIQKRPWTALGASLAVLVVLSLPVFSLELGGPHFGAGPTSHSSRRAYDLVTKGFGEGFNGPLVLVAQTDPAKPQQSAALDALIERVRATPGVALVAPPISNATHDTSVITVIPTTAPNTVATQHLVDRLRHHVIPEAMGSTDVPVAVSGVTALFVDMAELFNSRLLVFIFAVIVLSFLLLMVVFRSVLVPLKAAVMNLLSISAAYGVTVAVFQWGWGASLIGVDRTGPIMAFIPMMLFAILFGLSMDYEVFLLSRVREEYDRTGDNAVAVADGLAATARVITAAAAIMVFIFLSFVLGDDPIVKTFGLGLAVAVFVDATIVRMVLVPATMELLGDANWWLPKWLDRVLPQLQLESAGPEVAPTVDLAATELSLDVAEIDEWLGAGHPGDRNLVDLDHRLLVLDRALVELRRRLVDLEHRLVDYDRQLLELDRNLIENHRRLADRDPRALGRAGVDGRGGIDAGAGALPRHSAR